MNTFVVSYDLSKPGRDYPRLIEALESYGTYSHALESVWIIKTNSSASEVRDYLRGFVDSNDKLLVIDAGPWWAGFNLRDGTVKWLKTHVSG